jgi:hypothetical protein
MTRIFVWTVTAAVVTAAAAAAEPVRWTLQSTVSETSGTGRLTLGSFTFDGPDGPVVLVGDAALPTGSAAAEFENNAFDVRVASVPKGAYALAEVAAAARPQVAMDAVFTLSLAITDAASGQTGAAVFTGKPVLTVGSELGSPGELSLAVDGVGSKTLQLGGTRYEVTLKAGESDSGSHLVADVECVHDAPEPGTLALAGAGVVGLVGWRVRRKA